jgi:hypothetical protein
MLFLVVFLPGMSVEAADIYKCTDAEGNVAYLQTPCPIEKKPTIEPPSEIDVEVEAEEETVLESTQVVSNRSFEEIEACKDPYRDEVDAIYVALGDVYTPGQSEEFKKRLRTLTQHMRACG